jgi:hypothetical protein
MPARKFRTVEELNQPIWRRAGDPALFRAIAVVWALGQSTRPKHFLPDVRRFRSIGEMKDRRTADRAK